MATLWNKRKLAAFSRETQEITGSCQARNMSILGITEEYITQVSEVIEGRVTKNVSQEFSSTESCKLGGPSKLDQFLLSPQVRTLSGFIPGTSLNSDLQNREPTGDHSQNDPYPEVEFLACRTSNSVDFDPEEIYHMLTSLTVEILYCSPGTSSSNQKN